jgi:hypothetical protein
MSTLRWVYYSVAADWKKQLAELLALRWVYNSELTCLYLKKKKKKNMPGCLHWDSFTEA